MLSMFNISLIIMLGSPTATDYMNVIGLISHNLSSLLITSSNLNYSLCISDATESLIAVVKTNF